MAVTFREYECRSMLRMHKYVDNWFWSSATLSPYKACEHACNYCDGRSERYHASEDFDQIVHVKINAPEVLKKRIEKTVSGSRKRDSLLFSCLPDSFCQASLFFIG